MIRLEHLPADVLEPSAFARAVISGSLSPQLIAVPRRTSDIAPPRDALEPAARAALATTLESHLAPLMPHVAVVEAARELARPGACCVVTGQQPGLLASPLYTLYKALQSIAIARRLTVAFERPVAALF
jgi:uncharacterized protein YllA (UPF0747 family)